MAPNTLIDGEIGVTGRDPSPDAVRLALDKVLASGPFAAADQLAAFLRFVVEETLAGRSGAIKAYTIAVSVFGRDESFDPQTDSIVRVEGSRLRQRLAQYYQQDGRHDAVRIDLPKGGYVPRFVAATGPEAPPPRNVWAWAWRGRPARLAIIAAIGVVVAAIVGAATVVVTNGSSDRSLPSPVAQAQALDSGLLAVPPGPSIAVLPLVELNDNPGNGVFPAGLSDRIIANLTRFPDLFVVSPYTMHRFGEHGMSAPGIGDRLGVDYVLEGSAERLAGTLFVSARLTDAKAGRIIWSETFERPDDTESLFDIQREITERVVFGIAPTYGQIYADILKRLRRQPTDSLAAYECVLLSYSSMEEGSEDAFRRTRRCLEKAVVADPFYAEAWAHLAFAYLAEYRFGFGVIEPSENSLERARHAALRAVDLDPQSAMANSALSSVYFIQGDLALADWYGRRALALNPNDVQVLTSYANKRAFTGHWTEGTQMIRKALALSPEHPGVYHLPLALDYYRRGRYAEALAEVKKADMSDFYFAQAMEAMILAEQGDGAAAKAAARRAMALKPDFRKHVRRALDLLNLDEAVVERVIDGMRKAGIDVPEGPSTNLHLPSFTRVAEVAGRAGAGRRP